LSELPDGFEPDEQTRQQYVVESKGTWHVGMVGAPYYLQDMSTKREAMAWIVTAQRSRERISAGEQKRGGPLADLLSLSRADFDALPPARQREIAARLAAARDGQRNGGGDGGASFLMGALGLAPTPAERDAGTATADPSAVKVVDDARAARVAGDRSANLEKARAASTAKRAADLGDSTDPKDNGAKVRALRDGTIGHADLYRKIMAGPSGQRRDVMVGRIRHTPDNPSGEYRVVDRDGKPAGWITSVVRNGEQRYAVHGEDVDGGTRLLGWASSVSHAADVAVNGESAASTRGTLDAKRLDGGTFERNPNLNKTTEQLDREALDREIAQYREALADPRLGPGQRASRERRLAELEAERRGEPPQVDTSRVKAQTEGMPNTTNATSGEPTLGVTESSWGRTTTVTLPDGTTAKRTSKTMQYTHAVVGTTDLHADAADARKLADRLDEYSAALEAWIDAGSDRTKLKRFYTGGGSVNDQRAGLKSYSYYLPGFEPTKETSKMGSTYYQSTSGGPAVESPIRLDSAGNPGGGDSWDGEWHGPDAQRKTLDRARRSATDARARAAKLEAGPRYEYNVDRWSQRADTAFAAIGSPGVNRRNTNYQVVTVGGVARQDAKPAKVVPTAEDKAAAKASAADNITRHITAPVSLDIFESGAGQLDIAGAVYDVHRGNDGRSWVADGMQGDTKGSFTARTPADLAKKIADAHGVSGPISIEDEREKGKSATTRFDHVAKPAAKPAAKAADLPVISGPPHAADLPVGAVIEFRHPKTDQTVQGAINAHTRDSSLRPTYEVQSHGVDDAVHTLDDSQIVDVVRRERALSPGELRRQGPVPVGATDAQARAARPRIEGETDFAYNLRNSPSRDTATRTLNGYSAAGLRAIARDEGITVGSRATKDDLVRAIRRQLYDRHADAAAMEAMVNEDRQAIGRRNSQAPGSVSAATVTQPRTNTPTGRAAVPTLTGTQLLAQRRAREAAARADWLGPS
jgi:hypothetical protein